VSSDREAASGSAGVRVFAAADVHRLLTYSSAIEALERAFASLEMTAPPRSSVSTDRGTVLLMPAFGDAALGVKLVTLTPANPEAGLPFVQATYLLFDAATQSLRAVIDGSSLTAIRTAAVSALATRFLAAPDAHRLVIFGAGVQANSHLDAMRAVRPIDELVVVSRSPGAAEALVNRASAAGLRASVGAPGGVADADVVCTCTTSPDPIFDGSLLAEGAHVNAVGAYTLETRELDEAAVRDGAIVVETRDVALAEAGDLALAFGPATADRIDADLHEVVTGAKPTGHHSVFVSVGVAFEDLAVAAALEANADAG
jgi:ornithine cyclodeaminase/alanine dehydrogenase-like protein (mu-crystallin family)